MTEYDFSPGAYERYLATQRRIANWVDHTEGHRPEFGNAFTVQPAGSPYGSHSAPKHQQYQQQQYYSHPPTQTPASHSQHFYQELPRTPSKQQKQAIPHDTSSANLRSQASAQVPTYVMSVPDASGKPTYIYAPVEWVASTGATVVQTPSHVQNGSVVQLSPQAGPQVMSPQQYQYTQQSVQYSPAPTLASPAQSYAYPAYPVTVSGAGQPNTLVVYPTAQVQSPMQSPTCTPTPTLTQTMFAPGPPAYTQAYQHAMQSSAVSASPQIYGNHHATHTHTHTVLQPVIMPIIERDRERGGRSKSVGAKKSKKKSGKGEKEKGGGQRGRSEVRAK
ncbi:hypothetical protein H0H81_003997 [Sphagnurus paluster]|uniref:Uncharacterized protein n=1 Tax=Sphagnurus paluster TaxID=117069 RepID=A0A9P7K674_9AGAR|nr:hypothetical protein H0H81_003997 [Sphagnurus paluster]